MKIIFQILLIASVIFFSSCEEHLTELNINPNGVDPNVVNPNLVVPTIIEGTAAPYTSMNYEGDIAGVMQYVQKSGWGAGLNNYNWRTQRSWEGWYTNLRNAKHLQERSKELGMEFHQGLALVIRAFNFGYIADSWGDAPYTTSLNALNGGQTDFFPAFDTQETIYKGIIEELKTANTILSKQAGEYSGINPGADILYGGNPLAWRKFANTLMLRYYLRVSEKLPAYSKAGIEEIISNPSTYPVFTSIADDAAMNYIGSSNADSWPANTTFNPSQSEFDRIQLAAGLRDVLVKYNDPRLEVWFNKVRIPIKVSDQYGDDVIVGGVRYLHPNYMAANNMVVYNPDTWLSEINNNKILIDTMEYVGVPIAYTLGDASNYNLNPVPIQGGPNVHVSALDDKYKQARGPYLKARLISYAEMCFILAEAAQKGWSVGAQKDWYEKGVKASLDTWGVGGTYAGYITREGVAFNGSLEQIMVQKWIANWTVAHESWADWRRTGLPALTVGTRGLRQAVPLRFQYGGNEIARNAENYNEAIQRLQQTPFTAQDGNDSSWSKFWLIQGTNKPY
jgi:hypothetical protein